MVQSGCSGVFPGIEPGRCPEVLVPKELADSFVSARICTENDLGCEMSELVRRQHDASLFA
jgi:hypothetical protein